MGVYHISQCGHTSVSGMCYNNYALCNNDCYILIVDMISKITEADTLKTEDGQLLNTKSYNI